MSTWALQGNKSKLVIISTIGITSFIVWISYKFKQKRDKTLYQIANIEKRKDLLSQTIKLLDSEWKDKPNLHPTLSNICKDIIPCHRILIKISPKSIFDLNTMIETVIGHIYLKESYRDITLKKLQNMIKVKLPINAIKQRAKHAGIDLNHPLFYDKNGNLTFDKVLQNEEKYNGVREIYIGSLLIDKMHRRNGFAKLLLSESTLFVDNLGYGKLYGQAAPKLIQFYAKLGGNQENKKSWAMNAISTLITDEMLSKCRDTLKNSKHNICHNYEM